MYVYICKIQKNVLLATKPLHLQNPCCIPNPHGDSYQRRGFWEVTGLEDRVLRNRGSVLIKGLLSSFCHVGIQRRDSVSEPGSRPPARTESAHTSTPSCETPLSFMNHPGRCILKRSVSTSRSQNCALLKSAAMGFDSGLRRAASY